MQTKRVQASDAGQTAVHRHRPQSIVLARPTPRPGDPRLMEPRFGHDFSRVQVHTDAKAAESAQAVNALAYTVGRDVVFGSGQYTPGTHEGRKLIAHELTHVAQQRQNEPRPTSLTMGPAEDAFEAQAHSLPHQIVNGSRAITSELRPSGTRLQRACGPAEIGRQAGCIGRGGDITDFGGDSGKIFLFRVGCDDLLSGEEARVQILASAISPDNQLVIDGFASEEGPADFNEELSCARAKALASALIGAGISSNQIDGIYMHGATPGGRADRRSAVISVVSSSSPRAPKIAVISSAVVIITCAANDSIPAAKQGTTRAMATNIVSASLNLSPAYRLLGRIGCVRRFAVSRNTSTATFLRIPRAPKLRNRRLTRILIVTCAAASASSTPTSGSISYR